MSPSRPRRLPTNRKDDAMTDVYPRDLAGYGRHAPDPEWPDGARIALQFVINFEEGAENSILHGDEGSESLLTEFGFVTPRIGQRYLPVESMYEYGTRVGFWRLHEFFVARGVPITVFGVAMALERNPDAAGAMKEARWAIASHGNRWIHHHGTPDAADRGKLRKVVDSHDRVVR